MEWDWIRPRLGSFLRNELQPFSGKSIIALAMYQVRAKIWTLIRRSAEAEATPNRFADTNPTTRVLKFARLLHLAAGQLIWSNTNLAGVKLTTV